MAHKARHNNKKILDKSEKLNDSILTHILSYLYDEPSLQKSSKKPVSKQIV